MRPLRVLAAAGVMTLSMLTITAMAPADSRASEDVFGFSMGAELQYEPAPLLERDMDAIEDAGSGWVRIDIYWAEVQDEGPSSYDWRETDRIIRSITSRGMKVLGAIAYTPRWARPRGANDKYGPDPDVYAGFAAETAEHLAEMGVHHYEIWNEPNIGFWGPSPDPAAYTELLKAAYPAIKAADPQATVLTGGTAPASTRNGNYSPIDFLKAIYANGGGDSFDAVAHHPYCWPAHPGDKESWSAWHQMYGTNTSLRSVMSENGDRDKQIWGTEFGAPTNGPADDRVTEDEQAEMIAKAYALWKEYDWAGPLFSYQGRDLGTDTDTRHNFFGLLRHDFSEKPSYAAYQAAARGSGGGGGGEPAPDPGGDPAPDPGGNPAPDPGGDPAPEPGGDPGADPDDEPGPVGSTTTVTAKRRGKRAARTTVKGRVLTEAAASADSVRPTGDVELSLLRKSDGWGPASEALVTTLTSDGRFKLRLGAFTGRLDSGVYRVEARYLGCDDASPSTDRSRRFKLRA